MNNRKPHRLDRRSFLQFLAVGFYPALRGKGNSSTWLTALTQPHDGPSSSNQPIELSVTIDYDTTEVTVKTPSAVLFSEIHDIGTSELNDELISYLKTERFLLIGERTSEWTMKNVFTLYSPLDVGGYLQIVRGRNLIDGLPIALWVSTSEVREAIADGLDQIATKAALSINRLPIEVKTEIAARGIVLRSYLGELAGLNQRLQEATGLKVTVEQLDYQQRSLPVR